jgi:hypothetical protein
MIFTIEMLHHGVIAGSMFYQPIRTPDPLWMFDAYQTHEENVRVIKIYCNLVHARFFNGIHP